MSVDEIINIAYRKGLFVSEPHLNGNGDEMQIVISEQQYSWPILVINLQAEIRYGYLTNITKGILK